MIINLTQHMPTPEQVAAGVICLPDDYWDEVKELMTFDDLPLSREISDRACNIAVWAKVYALNADEKLQDIKAMIGGAPFLMSALEHELRDVNITPVYAFSRRESAEQPQPDGSVKKINVFRHIGFVETPPNEYTL